MSQAAATPGSQRLLGFWSLLALGLNGIVGVGISLLILVSISSLSSLDPWLAPLTLLAIAVLLRAAKLAELSVLAGVVLAGFVLQRVRRVLALRQGAR